MDLDTKMGIGVALNEAKLLGVEVDRERRIAAITFSVLALPADGAPPRNDSRVSMVLEQVGRVVASLRNAHWNDDRAPAVPMSLEELFNTVQSFGGLPVYGWEFIDTEQGYEGWENRTSLDESIDGGSMLHSMMLFQEGHDRHLDLRIWFGGLRVYRPDYTEIPLQEFIGAGKRWWDGLFSGDPRCQGHGIVPGSPPIRPVTEFVDEDSEGSRRHAD